MKWRTHPDVIWVDDGEGVRLYDARTNEFKTLNETGAAVWRQLAEGADEVGLVDALGSQYDAQDAHAWSLVRDDVLAFIAHLSTTGLVVRDAP